ncbi:unnamed protein product [Prorocentrum cordatum]|uniref:glucan endo-1,6-beta-glucosidase n=1 Tax=Prorocentrum cordatum TaxID=2364126 RepID=A0ABN9VIF1_9DINO|nr:unnamed protein product [Polarella glacialis]
MAAIPLASAAKSSVAQDLSDMSVGGAAGRSTVRLPGHSAKNRASGGAAAALAVAAGELAPEDHSRVLWFLASFVAQKRKESSKALSVLKALFADGAAPSWREAAHGDRDLLRALHGVHARAPQLVGGAVGDDAPSPAAGPPATSLGPDGDDAGAAEASSAAEQPPLDSPIVEEPPSPEAATPAAAGPETAAAGYPPAATADGPQLPLVRQETTSSVFNLDVADSATAQLMRQSFEMMASLDYEVDGRNLEQAQAAFRELKRAANRARFRQDRLRSPSPRRSNEEDEDDYLAGVLRDTRWDPQRVLKFLFKLQKARQILRNQARDLAVVLTQISASVCEHARSDVLFSRWLGTHRGPGETKAATVSYGLASALKLATWHAAAHFVSRRRDQKEGEAQGHLRTWERHKARVLKAKDVEFEEAPLKLLLEAAFAAAEHCVSWRFPDSETGLFAKRGLLQNGLGAITGREDFGPQKDLFFSLFDQLLKLELMTDDLHGDLRWMLWNLAWGCANKAKGLGWGGPAREALVRAERHFQRAHRGESQWRGVNLGGWFLLEPGPCTSFWHSLPRAVPREASCEWSCCEALGGDAARRLTEHRRNYFTAEDFKAMKAQRLTHVRLPFGAWCVDGPRPGEPYVGPCLELLDWALDALEGEGLMVLLDLHGCVGGESGGAPCGHRHDGWQPGSWDRKASLRVLEKVAKRYAGRVGICGIAVCNEPSEKVPARELAEYYKNAIQIIRQAGMRAGEVVVVLPVFTESRKDELLEQWSQNYLEFEDCIFDLHLYQCFGMGWNLLPESQHLNRAKARRHLLQSLPACTVGEWSLQLPGKAADVTPFDRTRRRCSSSASRARSWMRTSGPRTGGSRSRTRRASSGACGTAWRTAWCRCPRAGAAGPS